MILIILIIFILISFFVIIIYLFYTVKKRNKIISILERINAIKKLNENDYENKMKTLEDIKVEVIQLLKKFSYSKTYKNLLDLLECIIQEVQNAKRFKINRNEFLGNVAHELRTPIFAIQLSLETLLGGAINDQSVNIDFLNKALNHTKRLIELSDDLVTISKLETEMKLSKRYVKINELISEVVNSLNIVAQKKFIIISFNTEVKDTFQVFCDAEAIKQVMVNLIDNSIKYTNERGKINISVSRENSNVFISVSDTGIGIPEESLPRIFERFYIVDKNRSREMGGSGLGLSIVKHILELHNSKITVESKVGVGTTFRFYLPT